MTNPIAEVKLGMDVYTFATPAAAEEFRSCLMTDNLDDCKRRHPPVDVRMVQDSNEE